jgi:hypothetical protein
MTDAESLQEQQEILDCRREYFRRADAASSRLDCRFTDIDYAVAWRLVRKWNLTLIQADVPEVAALFRSPALTVAVANDGATVSPPKNTRSLRALHLFSPSNKSALPAGISGGSIGLCYGLSAAMNSDFLERLRNLGTASDPPVFLPLFGNSPALWRAASLLVCRRSQLGKLAAAVKQFFAAFACEGLDPLCLADENIALRAEVERLSGPGTPEAEMQRLQSIIGNLEARIDFLRRGIVLQEATIAGMRRSRGRLTEPEPVVSEEQAFDVAS